MMGRLLGHHTTHASLENGSKGWVALEKVLSIKAQTIRAAQTEKSVNGNTKQREGTLFVHLLSREHEHESRIPMGSRPSKRKHAFTSIWMPGLTPIGSSLISMVVIGVLHTSNDHSAEMLQGVISCGTILMICFQSVREDRMCTLKPLCLHCPNPVHVSPFLPIASSNSCPFQLFFIKQPERAFRNLNWNTSLPY